MGLTNQNQNQFIPHSILGCSPHTALCSNIQLSEKFGFNLVLKVLKADWDFKNDGWTLVGQVYGRELLPLHRLRMTSPAQGGGACIWDF